MITGMHTVVFSKDADADRAFFRDVLGFKHVDAGHGWLIFGMRGGEAAFHPSDGNDVHQLHLMCDDLAWRRWRRWRRRGSPAPRSRSSHGGR